jgi:antitoxin HicB
MTTAERPASTARVADYMQRPYLMEVVWDEDYWAITFPELPGLVAAADTWEELDGKIKDAKESYFAAALEDGLPIAEPGDSSEPASGRVLLRLPKTLHRQATRAASRDGVSVNTFLVAAVARELGRREPRQAASGPGHEGRDLMARLRGDLEDERSAKPPPPDSSEASDVRRRISIDRSHLPPPTS